MTMPDPLNDITPFADFESAGRAVLSTLSARFGFGLWMITRTEGADWIVLQTDDSQCPSEYRIAEGNVFNWVDSYCSRMADGLGPRVTENAQQTRAYHDAAINQAVQIGAYIGVPIHNSDGSLFGTLCAIDPQPQNPSIHQDLPLIETMARLLSSILAHDLKAIEQERALQKSQKEATTDALTGLKNRRGWDSAIADEETRAKRYGNSVSVLVVDIDGLKETNDEHGHAEGDDLIIRAAQALKSSVRDSDIVARLGGDEFGILALECDDNASQTLVNKCRNALQQHTVEASIGRATRKPDLDLEHAIQQADEAMYADKNRRDESTP